MAPAPHQGGAPRPPRGPHREDGQGGQGGCHGAGAVRQGGPQEGIRLSAALPAGHLRAQPLPYRGRRGPDFGGLFHDRGAVRSRLRDRRWSLRGLHVHRLRPLPHGPRPPLAGAAEAPLRQVGRVRVPAAAVHPLHAHHAAAARCLGARRAHVRRGAVDPRVCLQPGGVELAVPQPGLFPLRALRLHFPGLLDAVVGRAV
mmetsp:Transcript_26722/g.78708  ORF Transcript_26722/g.78708 Transcript_26722/m.78708 type:complete len:200 (-) Transcript_26722:514-1113(-)